jgi:hypothetical protein
VGWFFAMLIVSIHCDTYGLDNDLLVICVSSPHSFFQSWVVVDLHSVQTRYVSDLNHHIFLFNTLRSSRTFTIEAYYCLGQIMCPLLPLLHVLPHVDIFESSKMGLYSKNYDHRVHMLVTLSSTQVPLRYYRIALSSCYSSRK